jgi:hypothetical protein
MRRQDHLQEARVTRTTSGYERQSNDLYGTPKWATYALLDHARFRPHIVEPSCGRGDIANALCDIGYLVFATDIVQHDLKFQPDAIIDFETQDLPSDLGEFDIIMNPPYGRTGERKVEKHIERALRATKPHRGQVAALLPADFDQGISRRYLFADNPDFAGEVVLNRRILWEGIDHSGASPSQNHRWFIWQHGYRGWPFKKYADRGPKDTA